MTIRETTNSVQRLTVRQGRQECKNPNAHNYDETYCKLHSGFKGVDDHEKPVNGNGCESKCWDVNGSTFCGCEIVFFKLKSVDGLRFNNSRFHSNHFKKAWNGKLVDFVKMCMIYYLFKQDWGVIPWAYGTRWHKIFPKIHSSKKVYSGVKGTARAHNRMSARARFCKQ